MFPRSPPDYRIVQVPNTHQMFQGSCTVGEYMAMVEEPGLPSKTAVRTELARRMLHLIECERQQNQPDDDDDNGVNDLWAKEEVIKAKVFQINANSVKARVGDGYHGVITLAGEICREARTMGAEIQLRIAPSE